MKAVIIATGDCPNLAVLNERYPAPLLPLVDRPFIQHVVEVLVEQGVTTIDFVLSRMPEKIEHLLGDGTRWGSTFRFHLARDPLRPYKALKTIIRGDEKEPVLIAHADRLPNLKVAPARPSAEASAPVVFCWRDASAAGPAMRWTGWAWVSGGLVAGLGEDLDEAALAAHLISLAQGAGTLVEVPKPLGVLSYEEMLASHCRVLANEFPGLMLTGREVDKGIWLSRNVSLHPTAKLVPPVYVGENCRIGNGVRLGPDAVVGRNCVLDDHCIVSESLIFAGSYVGQALELASVIVDKNCLINVRVGAAFSVTDDFILGSMSDSGMKRSVGGALARVIGIVLLALTSPLLGLTALWLKIWRRGAVLRKWEVVQLPTSENEGDWRTFQLWSFCAEEGEPTGRWGGMRHFLMRFLPALINVARGELRFVGVSPRSMEAIRGLASDWKVLYLRAKAGIVTEAYITYGPAPTEDELYSAEGFYSAVAGVRHDLRLMVRYFARVLNPFSS